ncbi:HDOD domain-containing protein [Rubinisphaera sp.]|uniref:HDOD domain-containing protein n=1 Tax=Rubinisphaera sp. TaxID=2024857 RepID=UPI0025E516BD|nr:HDOD domain-containing protein [Rubinisphaera sp.]
MSKVAPRCLVVDDEPLIRNLAVRSLSQHGIKCDSTGDGHEASTMLAERYYDCALIDLQVPGKNGHALCVQALNLEHSPVVVVITGLAIPQIEEDLHKRGIQKIFHKPGNIKEIALYFRDVLQKQTVLKDQTPLPDDLSDEEQVNLEQLLSEPVSEFTSTLDSLPVASISAQGGTTEHFVIVVFCRAADRTENIASLIRSKGYSAIAATSSDHLLELLNSTRVDLLVIEKELRGFLDGIQIIESLCNQLLSVNVVLISADRMASLPDTPAMSNVIRKFDTTMSDQDLADSIILILKSFNSRPLMIDEHARRLVSDAERIPPMPHVLAKIISYLEQPVEEIDFDLLAKDIEIDARLTSELLRVTNSSSTGVAHQVTTTRNAIRLLGAKRAITLCLALGIRTMNSELLKPWGDELREWYLKRVALTASVARVAAQQFEKVPHESAFLLGIMQDLGILVFAEHYSEKYFTRVIQRVRTIGSLTLVASEKLVTNTNHAQVSAAVLRLWGFPPTIIEPVLLHHSPISNKESKIIASYLRCMKLAELFADFADNPVPQRRTALNDFVREHISAPPGECGAMLLQAVSQAQEMSRQFETPNIDVDTLKSAITKLQEED